VHIGKSVDLPPESEELAGWFAALLETEHAADEVFQSNFFQDWQLVLKKHPPVSIWQSFLGPASAYYCPVLLLLLWLYTDIAYH
jgi:hypothetical protein